MHLVTTVCQMRDAQKKMHLLGLVFFFFSLKNNEKIMFVLYLQAYNGNTGDFLQKFCGGNNPNPLFTTTNLLLLKFIKKTLSYVDTNGLYDITYIASNKGPGCGGQIFNYFGTFSSPGYPNVDGNSTDCLWEVSVPRNLRAVIHFTGKRYEIIK